MPAALRRPQKKHLLENPSHLLEGIWGNQAELGGIGANQAWGNLCPRVGEPTPARNNH